MRTLSLLALPLLPLALVSATPDPRPTTVVDILVECRCVPALELESPTGDTLPWVVSWTVEDDSEVGICAVGYCSALYDPRPCDGSFRISVGWAGPGAPTLPCLTAATISYKPEGSAPAQDMGKLDAAITMVHQSGAGETLVACAKASDLPNGRVREGDADVSQVFMSCGIAGNLNHGRKVNVREVCIGCEGPPPPK